MINRICKAAALLVLVTMFTGSVSAQTRIATVDLRKLFDGYYKTKQAQATLDERKAEIMKDLTRMKDEAKAAKEDYTSLLADANNQAVSSEERERRKKAAEDKLKKIKSMEDEIVQFERQAETRVVEQGRRMMDNLVKEITNVIQAKAKAANYSMVLDTSAQVNPTTPPIVLYSNGESDLTQAVLDQLNIGAPAESSNPPDKKEEKKSGKK